ncbi:MAG: hypothetical protein AVDCRST_MAG37-2240 [uncultured Rubrobacteraceae bacterium]|uniref:Uncharacterized protein n=1 Tax=uncultured Rubrobacteraceae bacterium TaxID=349277 RepID=A0A6J4QQ17_9ACTN|nr:MAG: hypothetical protein AVDCRST_MAG37-2240 [uncultured Rubrobacteraceae bacterium]
MQGKRRARLEGFGPPTRGLGIRRRLLVVRAIVVYGERIRLK